jgi:hypothetical protein
MAIEQIIAYLKENLGRYSKEQLQQALLKAGYPAQEVDNAMKMVAANPGVFPIPRQQGAQLISVLQTPRNLGNKIFSSLGGFLFAVFLTGVIVGLGLFTMGIYGINDPGDFSDFNQMFLMVIAVSGIAIAVPLFVFFRIRKRSVYFSRGMLAAIILQGIGLAVVVFLLSVVFHNIEPARERSSDARRIADIKQIQLALELYWGAHNGYPNELSELAPKFIPLVPRDPLSSQPYVYEKKPDGSYYLKAELAEHTNYALLNDINPGNQFYEVSASPQPISKPPPASGLKSPPAITEIPHDPNLKCADTDGGDKPYSRGSVTGTGRCIVDGVTQDCGTIITETDVCVVNYGQSNFKPTVIEYFCASDGRITGQSRVCKQGCENGVCR